MNHRFNTGKYERVVLKICVSILFNDNYSAKEKAINLLYSKFTVLTMLCSHVQ